jgi:DnaJ-class molecular chaperone
MSESESFYNILGVTEKASKNDIKRAYRDLSLKYHPDRNCGNTDFNSKFQEINEAYETLSDDQKREGYDQSRRNPFMSMSSGGGGGSINLDDLLNNLFGGGVGGMFSEGGFQPHIMHQNQNCFNGNPNIRIFHTVGQNIQKPIPIVKTININMEQILNGGTIPVEIERWIIENGLKVFENETIYVSIPQGIDDNEIIILKNKGNVLNDDCRGDLKLFVKVENNTEFERHGLDLLINKTISLKESLCGFSFELKYINGKTYTLNNSLGNIIPPNYKKVIPNMGLTRDERVGNLIIHFIVEFPEKIEINKLEELINIL